MHTFTFYFKTKLSLHFGETCYVIHLQTAAPYVMLKKAESLLFYDVFICYPLSRKTIQSFFLTLRKD